MSSASACCSLPPVSLHYDPKGRIIDKYGFDTYATGNEMAAKQLVFVYDIFGLKYPQTKQLADMLADALDASVLVPDFLRGDVWDKAAFMQIVSNPDSDKSKLTEYFSTTAEPTKNTQVVADFLRNLQAATPQARVGVAGFCWGGKVATKIGALTDVGVRAVASCHPAFVDAKDAEALCVPICFLPSKDEPKDACEAFQSAMQKNEKAGKGSIYRRFETVQHGFLAARGDLSDPENKKCFDEAARLLHDFFKSEL